MLSLLKKKSDASAAPIIATWHPDFRNLERLPDTKVVRTAFFINAAAITLALGLLTYFGVKEWELRSLKSQIADWQRQIDRDQAGSDKAVALYKNFQGQEAKFQEVDAFLKSKPLVSELMVRLAQTLPANIALDSFDLSENRLSMHITVRGAPDVAPTYANAYLDQLRADKQLSRFDQTAFKGENPQRNTTTGRLTVEISMPLKKEAKKP